MTREQGFFLRGGSEDWFSHRGSEDPKILSWRTSVPPYGRKNILFIEDLKSSSLKTKSSLVEGLFTDFKKHLSKKAKSSSLQPESLPTKDQKFISHEIGGWAYKKLEVVPKKIRIYPPKNQENRRFSPRTRKTAANFSMKTQRFFLLMVSKGYLEGRAKVVFTEVLDAQGWSNICYGTNFKVQPQNFENLKRF